MRKIFFKFASSVFLFAACLLVSVFLFNYSANSASAADLTGYAWGENYGWISFNCVDNNSCGTVDYKVSIDENRNFSGYAWNDGAGWISFSETSGWPSSPSCPAGVSACFNVNNNKIYGWAKVLSLGDDGWIRLDDNNLNDSVNYGVSINSTSGEFLGWAWDGNANDSGMGWISFNNETDGSSVEYHVEAPLAPSKPSLLVENYGSPDFCSAMYLSWSDVYNQESFDIFRDGVKVNSVALNAFSTSYPDSGLNPNQLYSYKVRAYNSFGYTDSDAETGTTMPVCNISSNSFLVNGECPGKVTLDWPTPVHACDIIRYELGRCEYSGSTCENFNPISNGACQNPIDSTCIDDVLASGESVSSKYQYRVRAVAECEGDDEEIGEWSATFPAEGVIPCRPMPKWQETR